MSDLLSDDEDAGPERKFLDFAKLKSDLRIYYPLLIVLIVLFLAASLGVVAESPTVYTATAVVGPADNSDQPFGLDAGGGGGGMGGIAKHLHVGGLLGGGGSEDTFNEYTSLLSSTRLAWVLVNKDHLMPQMFPNQWDAVHNRWYPRDSLFDRSVDFLKTLLRRPVKPGPDVDDLMQYFDAKMNVDLSLETSFATVTFKYRNPAEAERILSLLLLEADNIIRQDKRRNVSARIAYLNTALEKLNNAEEKPAMIDILSEQEQEMMMVESDHRYASILIDPPHAPLVPSSPVPSLDAAIGLILSFFAWVGAVRLTPNTGPWRRLLELFARRPVRRSKSASRSVAEAGSPVTG